MRKINKFLKWCIAVSTYRQVWRVTYKDGRRTYLLSYQEAHGLAKCFDGRLWIDYDNGYF